MRVPDLSAADCVGYVRVSTEAQAGEKQTSLADQRAAIHTLAAQLGRTVAHIFEDAGVSGALAEQREGLQALVSACEAAPKRKKRPGYVLALNDSRWGRFEDSEEATYWRVHLAKRGWIVRFAEQDDVQDKQLRPVLRTLAQTQATLYRDTLKANVKRGTKGTAEQGYWQSMAPFGYRRKVVFPAGRERVLPNDAPKATDEKVILEPEPKEAAIVRELFDRYATGTETLMTLVEWVLVRWPDRKWNRASMRFLLTNPAYVGDVVWGRHSHERDERGQRMWRPDAEWYGRPNAHPPIVSRDVFAIVQRRMDQNRRRTRGVRSDWILSGIVRCRCGASFAAGGTTRADYPNEDHGSVYRCSTRGLHPSARCQFPGTVLKTFLEDAVLRTLGAEIGSPAHRTALRDALARQRSARRTPTRTVTHIDKDVDAVRQKQQRLVAAIEADAVSTIEARDRMTALRRTLADLTAERERVQRAMDQHADSDASLDALVALAMDFRTAAKRLSGPALRELVRPWIKYAVFNTETRDVTIEIRRIPASGSDSEGVGSASKAPVDVVTRVVRVGARA